jgi:dTMP kinase
MLPKAQAVAYFDIPAEQAYERIALRGEDKESLEDLQRFRKAYMELPWYPSFTVIDAGGSTKNSALQLQQLIAKAMGSPASLPQ